MPDNRTWFWWDAVAVDVNNLVVAVENVRMASFPSRLIVLGLLRGAGAVSVEAEDNSERQEDRVGMGNTELDRLQRGPKKRTNR